MHCLQSYCTTTVSKLKLQSKDIANVVCRRPEARAHFWLGFDHIAHYECWTQEEPHLSAVRRAGTRSSRLLPADAAVGTGPDPVPLSAPVAVRLRSKIATAAGRQDPQAVASLRTACDMKTSISVPLDSF